MNDHDHQWVYDPGPNTIAVSPHSLKRICRLCGREESKAVEHSGYDCSTELSRIREWFVCGSPIQVINNGIVIGSENYKDA